MLAVLEFFDLVWIAIIVGGVIWYFGVEAQTQRVEKKLDRILEHLGIEVEEDDNESTPQ